MRGRDYCICPIDDGLLYVEFPNYNMLRNFLITQRWRGTAHLRTRHGYVPYFGGGIAFDARPLLLHGVKPLWFVEPGGDKARAVKQLLADGVYEDYWEAERHYGHQQYAAECEWEGPRKMWIDPAWIDHVWIAPTQPKRIGRPMKKLVKELQRFLPRGVPIYPDAPDPAGWKPCRA